MFMSLAGENGSTKSVVAKQEAAVEVERRVRAGHQRCEPGALVLNEDEEARDHPEQDEHHHGVHHRH